MNQLSKKEQIHNICKECGGLCCKIQCATIRDHDKYQEEYWKARGYLKKIKIKGGVLYLTPQVCQHLDENNRCAIYRDRPQLCRDYPNKYLHPSWQYFCPLWRWYDREKKQRNSVYRTL